MARRPSTQPTDGELEILRVLWDAGPSGLGAIREALGRARPVAVTTVATMLKMMLEKGLVERGDGPKGYVWSARLTRKAAASGMIGKLVSHVFDGSARRLVAHLIEDGALDERERLELMRMLAEAKEPTAASKARGSKKQGGGR